MNYLLIIDCLGSGGAERQCVALAIRLKQIGHNVDMLGYTKGDHYYNDVIKAGIQYFLIEESNPLLRILRFRKKIKELNPAIIIAFLQTSSVLAELSSIPRKPWKLIVSERNEITFSFSFKTRIVLQLHKLADAITTNSESSTVALLAKAPFLKRKVHTIYNGLDIDRFFPTEKYVPSDRKKLVVVSSHQKHKNAKNLILALKKLKDATNSILPIISWYGSDVSYTTGIPSDAYLEAKNLIEENNLQADFFLKDPVGDIENIYRTSDALLLCSFWEGLPNAVCEAMACGLPILMSKVSDHEVLTKGNGTSFDPYFVDPIAEAINWFCNLPVSEILQMRSVSRKKAENLFPLDKMVDSYIKLTESC